MPTTITGEAYSCSDEAINELAEANGYLFFKNGSLIPHELYPKK